MRQAKIVQLIAGGLVILAAGCGGSDQTGTSGNAVSTNTATKAADWNATDACALIDRKVVAAAAGTEVNDARLDGVLSDEGTTLSTCSFILANNGTISLFARKSHSPDFSAEAVEKARTMDGAMPAAVDVPGLGRAALWTRETNALQVFIDDTRHLTISVFNPPAGKDAKSIATAIAGRID